MKKNMGFLDRMIRLFVAVIIAMLYYFNFINGTLAIILGAIAIIFTITSFVKFCPLYAVFGVKTCKN